MPTDYTTLEMGPCSATFKGTDLGLTKGGVEVSFSTETKKVEVDQFGDTIVSNYITSRNVSVKVPIAEANLNRFASIFPGVTLVGSGLQKKLLIKAAIGTSLRDLAGPLVLHPLSKAQNDLSGDFAIPLAMTAGEFSFAYKHDEQRMFTVEFEGYTDPDSETLFIMGAHDLSGSTSPTLSTLTAPSPTVAENSAPNTVVTAISGKTVGSTLSLIDSAGGRFALSGSNVIVGSNSPNFENATSHTIIVRETLDGATNSPRDTSITISVTNVLEAPTLSALSGTFTLAENAPAAALAGSLGGKTSGSTLTLISDAGGRVALSGSNIVRGANALDYETATSHSFTVRETLADSPNSPRDTTLSLVVTDIDETILAITSANPSGSFPENNVVSDNLTANKSVTWTKSGTDASLITLNASTGAWSITQVPDYETKATYSWTFTATDGGGATASQNIAINISDVADTASVAPNYLNTTAVMPYMAFGAQRVISGYSGPLYRIRRDSDNAEMDVVCQTGGDYPNYADIETWAGSAGVWVPTVYDQTGNGRHISNTSTANQPRLDTAIKVAGCAPIVFDGYGRSSSGGLPQAQIAKSLTVGSLVGLVRNNMSYLMASQSQVSYNTTRYIAFRPEDNSVDTSGIELQSGLLNGQRIGGLSSLDTWGAALEASNRRYFSMQGNANQAATNPADVLQRMTIGDKVGAIAYAGMYRMFALAVYNTALSATDGANAQLSLNTAFSVPANAPYRVVFDGSSGMEGSGSSLLRNVVAQLDLTKRPEMFNMGVHGQSLASIYSGRVARFSGRYTSSRPCVFFEQGGANDLFGSDTPAATLYANTTTPLVSYLKGLGYKVVLCTIPPIGTTHSLYTTTRENERLAYNDLIRANSAGADGVCDWASDPVMGIASGPDNLTYYTGDKQHPTSAGYARYAVLVRNSLESVLRTTALGASYVP